MITKILPQWLVAVSVLVVTFHKSGTAFAESALFVVDAAAKEMVTVSTTDASVTSVGRFDVPGIITGLAYDGGQNILYGSTSGPLGATAGNNLVRIDPITGSAIVVGAFGTTLMHSLAFDSSSGILYGASKNDASLYRIDTTSGTASRIGSIGVFGFAGQVTGLAFDSRNNTLYGCLDIFEPDRGGIVTINTLTGAGNFLFAAQSLQSIAFHPDTGVLYGVHNGFGQRPDALYTVDLESKTTSLVGLTGLGNSLGMEFLPVPVPEPQVFFVLTGAFVGMALVRTVRKRCM